MAKAARFAASGAKRRYVYVLTPKSASENARVMRRFLTRKIQDGEPLRREIDLSQSELGQKSMDSHEKPAKPVSALGNID